MAFFYPTFILIIMKKTYLFLAAVCFIFSLSIAGAESLPASVIATIDASSLSSVSSKPTLSGSATGTKTLKVEVRKEGSNKILYKKTVKVKKDEWKTKISKKLSDGAYDVEVSGGVKGGNIKTVASGTLLVGKNVKSSSKSSGTLVVSSIPLLSGGSARANATVALSYLQVTNTGKEAVVLKGFWVKQNGTADTRAILSLSTVDDKGASRGFAGGIAGADLFKSGLAYAPITDGTFLPGQMRLFTIKAGMAANASSYAGKNLMIDVASLDADGSVKGAFPIRGTTWTIVQ